ncbi:MAG: anti-sigma factor domain-containing protein [Gemmatimonadota bacterium]
MNETTRMSDDQFQELAIAHLLRELDAVEETAFAVELMRRGEPGHALLREIQETLGDIALAVAPAEPPVSLRGRVLARIEAVTEPEVPPARERSLWPWAAAAVLAALTVGLGLWAARLADERDRLRAAVDRLEERVAAADSAEERVAALQEDLDLVSAPGSAVHGLVGTQALPQAGARVFVDPVTGRALLFAYDLPVLGPDELYELWAIGAEGPRAAGVFRPGDEGRARLEIPDPELLRDVQTLAVTVEPAPGVEQPTGEIVLSSDRS